jgi:signal transduction histidine kinase
VTRSAAQDRHAALLALGDRYAGLGLAAAARGAFERALRRAADDDPEPARRLSELALARGDSALARAMAEQVVARAPGPASRLLLGRAQLEDGALDAARLSFVAVLEGAGADPELRARAHLGLARVAAVRADTAGAGANAMAAVDELISIADDVRRIDDNLPLVEEVIRRAVIAGRSADLMEAIAGRREAGAGGAHELLRAIALAIRQSRGEAGVTDDQIESALARELEAHPGSVATRLYLAERMMRRRGRQPAARAEAIGELGALRDQLAAAPFSPATTALRARVEMMLAAAYEEDPATVADAEEAYRAALALRPDAGGVAGRLALLALARGDQEAARDGAVRALRIDGDARLGWRTAAQVVASLRGVDADEAVAALLAAAGGDNRAAIRLLAASNEVARELVLHGVHARGHRLKNLLGIIGARVRSARKLAGDDDRLVARLGDLEGEVTNLYDEWAAYLRSMQSPTGGVIELVPVTTLLDEVVAAARARTSVVIDLRVEDGLPDLRGDRMLLSEALLNVIHNAAEACEGSGGRVEVTASAGRPGSAPVVEIEVADSGPGIARGDLARVFSPGFTTKESGSGVGLVIAERVIASHHGRILIDSELGRGTRVSLMLPSDLGGFAGLASFPLAPRGGQE